ncbi:hypothetical protein LTR64_000827 [Lithohypha guttulata]|uniref:uncharacterized protein n=1 Tax=Lithohypha guttulata TaxID=1690604 RepID=UPI002DE18F8E|nr:hypothetical protein LTR51_005407 [Lithohypha guttulata]
MSFLSRSTPLLRQAGFTHQAPRLFSTAVVLRKGPIETGKDALKAVDRTISDAAVKGIDKGVELKDKAADTVGTNASKATEATQDAAQNAQYKAGDLGAEAQGKANEIAGKAKGAAAEAQRKTS